MHPAETLRMLQCCSQLGMPKVGLKAGDGSGDFCSPNLCSTGAGECIAPEEDMPSLVIAAVPQE